MAKRGNGERSVRIQMSVPPKSALRLDNLVAKTEASSYAEVTRQALQLYEAVIEAKERGEDFCLRKADGSIQEMIIVA